MCLYDLVKFAFAKTLTESSVIKSVTLVLYVQSINQNPWRPGVAGVPPDRCLRCDGRPYICYTSLYCPFWKTLWLFRCCYHSKTKPPLFNVFIIINFSLNNQILVLSAAWSENSDTKICKRSPSQKLFNKNKIICFLIYLQHRRV